MVLNIIAPVFLVIILSYIVGKIIKIELKPLIDISVYLTVPALVFTSILKEEFVLNDFMGLFFGSIFVMLASFFIMWIFFKISKDKRKGLYLPVMFMNTGNIGFPICLYAFGQAGLTQAILYSTATSLLVFSLGVYLAAKKMNLREVFKLPLVYGVVLGIVFAVMKISVPEIIFKPLDMIGTAAIPLQLIILGVSLSKVKIHHIWPAVYGSIARFGLGLTLALVFVAALGITGLTKNIIILQSTMPAALFTIILSHKYKRNAEIVASVVFISTILSIITIPAVLWFLG